MRLQSKCYLVLSTLTMLFAAPVFGESNWYKYQNYFFNPKQIGYGEFEAVSSNGKFAALNYWREDDAFDLGKRAIISFFDGKIHISPLRNHFRTLAVTNEGGALSVRTNGAMARVLVQHGKRSRSYRTLGLDWNNAPDSLDPTTGAIVENEKFFLLIPSSKNLDAPKNLALGQHENHVDTVSVVSVARNGVKTITNVTIDVSYKKELGHYSSPDNSPYEFLTRQEDFLQLLRHPNSRDLVVFKATFPVASKSTIEVYRISTTKSKTQLIFSTEIESKLGIGGAKIRQNKLSFYNHNSDTINGPIQQYEIDLSEPKLNVRQLDDLRYFYDWTPNVDNLELALDTVSSVNNQILRKALIHVKVNSLDNDFVCIAPQLPSLTSLIASADKKNVKKSFISSYGSSFIDSSGKIGWYVLYDDKERMGIARIERTQVKNTPICVNPERISQ